MFWNRDYTPYAKKRDEKLEKLCKKIDVECFVSEDYYLHPPNTIFTGSGTPYLKYTPYMHKVFSKGFPKPNNKRIKNLVSGGRESFSLSDAYKKFVGNEIGSVEIPETYERSEALEILRDHSEFKDYDETRNDLITGTTRLSAPIKFGIVSIREVAEAFKKNKALLRQLVLARFLRANISDKSRSFGKRYEGAI